MEKERRITAPEGCEIEKVELVDGATFKEKEPQLPKNWEEFCEPDPNTYSCATCHRRFCVLRWFGCGSRFWKGKTEFIRIGNYKLRFYPMKHEEREIEQLKPLYGIKEGGEE